MTETSEQEERARAILAQADQEIGLEALVHEDDRDLLPFAIKKPGDYLAWLLVAAGRAEQEADDPCEDGDEEQMASYRLALACYKYATRLLLIGITPTRPTCRKCRTAEPMVHQLFCTPCWEQIKAEYREAWEDIPEFMKEDSASSQALEELILSLFVDSYVVDEPDDELGSTGESPEEEKRGDFSTICPYCKQDGVTVIEVTLVSDGLVLNPMVPLERDGFAFDTPDDRKDASTQDEVVRCNNCGCEFGLDELM